MSDLSTIGFLSFQKVCEVNLIFLTTNIWLLGRLTIALGLVKVIHFLVVVLREAYVVVVL